MIASSISATSTDLGSTRPKCGRGPRAASSAAGSSFLATSVMPALRVICCWLGETLRTFRLSRRLVCGLLFLTGDELITRRAASLMAWHT